MKVMLVLCLVFAGVTLGASACTPMSGGTTSQNGTTEKGNGFVGGGGGSGGGY